MSIIQTSHNNNYYYYYYTTDDNSYWNDQKLQQSIHSIRGRYTETTRNTFLNKSQHYFFTYSIRNSNMICVDVTTTMITTATITTTQHDDFMYAYKRF